MNYEIITRGQNAKRVLETPEFKSTLDEVRRDIFDQFKRTNVMERSEREEIHRIAYAVDMLVAKLEKYWEIAEYEIKVHSGNPE